MLDFPVDPAIVVLHPDGRVTYSTRPSTQPITVTVQHLLTAELDDRHRAHTRMAPVPTGWCVDLVDPDLPANRLASHVLGDDDPSHRRGPVALSWRPAIERALDVASERGLIMKRDPTLRNDALTVHPRQLIDHLADHGWQFLGVRAEEVFVSSWLDPSDPAAVVSAPLSSNTQHDLWTMYMALRDLAGIQQRGVVPVIEEISAVTIDLSSSTLGASAAELGLSDEITEAEQRLRADFDIYHALRYPPRAQPDAPVDAQAVAQRWLSRDDVNERLTWLELDTLAAARHADTDAVDYLHAVVVSRPGSAGPLQLRHLAHVRDLVPPVYRLGVIAAVSRDPARGGTLKSNPAAIDAADPPARPPEAGPGL